MKGYVLVKISYPDGYHQYKDCVACGRDKAKIENLKNEYNLTLTPQEEKDEIKYEIEKCEYVE